MGKQISLDNINSIAIVIQTLRESDFDYPYHEAQNLLIAQADTIRPLFHPHENEIQALKYLKGMLIIACFSDNITQDEVMEIYNKYKDKEKSAKNTHEIAERFALLLKEREDISLKKAREQITMARDLGILLENHPGIRTISVNGNQATSETSRHVKISKDYYDDIFNEIDDQVWFKNAKKHAGFKENAPDTWLDKFFHNQTALDQLMEKGVPAPPSARWLPLPASALECTIKTGTITDGVLLDEVVTTEFVRIGTTSAFEIEDVEEQKKIAVKILVEIITARIIKGVNLYKEKYKEFAQDPDGNIQFFVNYQTLLSPHYFQAYFYPAHKDNNAAFVEMAKEAMNEAKKNITEKLSMAPEMKNVKLVFTQTNSAINKQAGYVSTKEFDEDRPARNAKLEAVAALINRIDPKSELIGYIRGTKNIPGVVQLDEKLNKIRMVLKEKDLTEQTKNEIILRINAAVHLRLLMDNESPYKDLPTYQHNIMQASLELLAQGDQGIKLVGCKSARDRTAILAAAVKTMQQNPRSMDNWELLNAGIMTSLKQGHHFRSMSYHVAMVKVNDAHSDFMKQLDKDTQRQINETQVFAKTLGSIDIKKENKAKHSKNQPQESKAPIPIMQSSSTNILKKLEDPENTAIANLKKFEKKILDDNKKNTWGVRMGHQITYNNKKQERIPTNVNTMLSEIAKANHREQSFQQAWQNIAKIATTARNETSFFRSDYTKQFYNNTLSELNIDPVESLKKIAEVIKQTNWHVRGMISVIGNKPKNVQNILDTITNIKEKNAYDVLNTILAIAAKAASSESGGNNVLRHKETQQFYENITQYLVPLTQTQNLKI